ncbi:MAG: hypothetical protein UT24_C0006G0017 [Candidatus Woesebacteria bacterium GW2011_GWB1_39_12]|uniref:Uncharacterized protein n=2 Tax=Candidatus Woeseibacteriota TaxID=1752722 RepID=A0A0G0M2X0_9BACT|nr:MAG: hypothetical protein UT23_C0010G0018 [Candidatus Woesebacteria bacterium GW2011_GWA1_39_12]KKR01169.1 MAG: hypothetical protein UT24_C0006G0017 [Candidatus Woesebacteria bacterium GW2011_GWB1_39_12]
MSTAEGGISRRGFGKMVLLIGGAALLGGAIPVVEEFGNLYGNAIDPSKFLVDPKQSQDLGGEMSGGDKIQAGTSGEIDPNAKLIVQQSENLSQGQAPQMIVVGEGESLNVQANGPYGQALECELNGVSGEVRVKCTDNKGNLVNPVDIFTSDGPNVLIPRQPDFAANSK